jgi:hypothetical protein
LLRTAARLRTELPDVNLVGVDWGIGAGQAAEVGIFLRPMLSGAEFRALLASADVVVGQQVTGSLGIADLEAMAMGRPLVAKFTAGPAYGEDAPLWNTNEVDPADAVRAILDDPQSAVERAQEGRAWALRHHAPDRFVARMQPLYLEVVNGSRHG